MFPERLKMLRENRNLTQADLGKMFNLSKQTISAYEKGDASPPVDTLVLLADFFKVTTDFLLGRQTEAVEEEGFLYGLNPEAKKRVFKYANYERDTQQVPDNDRDGSSGLTDSDKNGNGLNLKRSKRRKAAGS